MCAVMNSDRAERPTLSSLLIEPDSDAFHNNPYPTYKLLRLLHPVVYWPKGKAWLVTSHKEVVGLISDSRFSSRFKDWAGYQPSLKEDLIWRSCESEDLHALSVEDVSRLRGLLSSYFSERNKATIRALVEQVCNQKLFRIKNTRSFDLISDYANDVSIRVVTRLFGIPERYLPLFIQFANAYIELLDPGKSYANSELQKRIDCLLIGRVLIQDAIRDRGRRGKGAFLIDYLIEMRHNGSLLSDTELVSLISILAVGGLDMSRILLANTILNVLRSGVLPLLKSDEGLWENTVREVARYDFPQKLGTARYVLEDCWVGGVKIKKGEMVYPVIAAAQRDPAAFDRPDEFDITRDTSRVITYDLGFHPFIGLDLAILESEVAARRLFEVVPNLGSTVPPSYDPMHRTLRAITAYKLETNHQIRDIF